RQGELLVKLADGRENSKRPEDQQKEGFDPVHSEAPPALRCRSLRGERAALSDFRLCAFGVLFFRSPAAHVRIMRLPPRHPNWQPGAIKWESIDAAFNSLASS